MLYEITADYEQGLLIQPYIADRIPADHPARFIKVFIKSLDLPGLGFKITDLEVV